MKVKVKCIKNYIDMQLNKAVTTKDEPFIVNKVRAEELVAAGVCEVIPEAILVGEIPAVEEEPTKEEVNEKAATKSSKKAAKKK